MALSKAKYSEIPSDAVVLTESEAVLYQSRILNKWQNSSDVFAYKYGSGFLASLAAVSGIYINNYYRRKFMLHSYGRVSSFLPIAVLPACLSLLSHIQFVLPDVLLQKSCAICVELRASALQAVTGCVLPGFLAPLSTFALATRYGTYDVPYITKEPMKVFHLWFNKTKPLSNTLFSIFLAQAFAASLITYFEAKSVAKCNETLLKLEQDVANALVE